MANSSAIGNIKNKIIKEFIKDNEIVQAIGSTNITSPEKLVNTHIFNYHQNPYTLNTVSTFLTIQVHIPESFYEDGNGTFVSPTLEIWIISHESHMIVDNVPKVTQNRNDYLAELITRKLNGRSGLGIGKLKQTSNTENSYQQDYLYRRLTFKGLDLNYSMCEEDE